MPRPLNVENQRFGRLVARWPDGGSKSGIIWLCTCDCGNLRHIQASMLSRGRRESCGCLVFTKALTNGQQIGGKKTPEMNSYATAKNRCSNLNNHRWEWYGGRGIQFKFQSFEEFFAAVGKKPGSEYSIDRINNDGHYEPGNVRWATKKEQAKNQRKRRTTCR